MKGVLREAATFARQVAYNPPTGGLNSNLLIGNKAMRSVLDSGTNSVYYYNISILKGHSTVCQFKKVHQN